MDFCIPPSPAIDPDWNFHPWSVSYYTLAANENRPW